MLTFNLQKTNIDPETVCSKLKDFKNALETMRSDDVFDELWDATMELEPTIPRQRKANVRHLTDSGFTPAAHDEITIQQRLKALLFDIIACLNEELDSRFSGFERFQWIQLVHPSNFQKYANDDQLRRQLIQQFIDTYPTIVKDKDKLFRELSLLYNDSDVKEAIKDAKDVSDLNKIMHMLDMATPLPNVALLVATALTIAITSVSCERTFSVLRRIKNYTRASMTQQRTTHLMLLAVESQMLDYLSKDPKFLDDCIDIFSQMKERRISLVYKK